MEKIFIVRLLTEPVNQAQLIYKTIQSPDLQWN